MSARVSLSSSFTLLHVCGMLGSMPPLKESISIGYRQNEKFSKKTPMVLSSFILRTPEYFTQVICHFTEPALHICVRHSPSCDVNSRGPQCCWCFGVFVVVVVLLCFF